MLKTIDRYLPPSPIFYLLACLDSEGAIATRAELHVISFVEERLFLADRALTLFVETLLLFEHRPSPYNPISSSGSPGAINGPPPAAFAWRAIVLAFD